MSLSDRTDPAWFAAVMGTAGVAAVAAVNPSGMPSTDGFSHWVGVALMAAAVALFALLCVLVLLGGRLSMDDLKSPVSGPAYAAIPGAVLVIGAGVFALDPGLLSSPLGWALGSVWTCFGAVLAVGITVVLFVAAFEHANFDAADISGIWFVPETALLLAAFLTSALARTGPVEWARTLTLAAMGLLGAGAVLFAFTAAVFINRLMLLPQHTQSGAPALWIMISPLSVTSLAMHFVADDARFLGGSLALGVEAAANFLAVILWGFSMWWVLVAALLTWHVRRTALRYTAADWGFVFPAAALTLATITLGRDWQSGAMQALGFAFSLTLLAIWTAVVIAAASTRLGRTPS